MTPALHDISIYIGNTLNLAFRLRDDDDDVVTLLGYSGTCEVRKKSDSTLIFTPTVTVTGATGVFQITATAAETAALTADEAALRYDVRLSNGTNIQTPCHGDCVLLPRVTMS